MKSAPVQTTNEGAAGAADYTPGKMPKRKDSVVAAVLASLLESKTMTGMESVFKQSTTRLGAVIHYLENKYAWHIDRKDFAAGTSDGRIAHPSAYWLPQATIAKAFDAGAREWIESVNAARAERRKQSEKCKAEAAQRNSRKHFKNLDPRQDNLWGEQ